MSKQSQALRLADWLDAEACGGSNWNAKMNAAAAELRRLYAKCELQKTVPTKYQRMEFNAQLQMENDSLRAQRDELLEALKEMLEVWEEDPAYGHASAEKARAAIAKAQKP